MRTFRGIGELEKLKTASVVTIGNYDGVHAGHREIISKVVIDGANYS